MKRPLIFLAFVGCLSLTSSTAIADGVTSIRLAPNPALPTDNVRVRVDVEGCDSTSGIAQVSALEHEIQILMSADDSCDAGDPDNFVSPRYIPVGQLPVGVWRVNYISCTNAPPPLPPCQTFRTEVLQVVGELPTTVPLSWALSATLMCALAGSGIFLIGRHLQRV